MIKDIRLGIDEELVDKIINKKENMEFYLNELYKQKKIQEKIPSNTKDLIDKIIATWDYEISKNIIRDMFRTTEKYIQGKSSDLALEQMEKEWKELNLGNIDWPFSAMMFDQYIQGVNTSNLSEKEKDDKVKLDVVKFRRIKRINTFRNDYIEYLVFENHDNIVPTLKHRRNLDFIINGKSYDQKVSKSVTSAFIKEYGDDWRNVAIEHPEYVARVLYEQQDEERFGCEPRLLIVYIDSDVDTDSIENEIRNANFENPMEIEFNYKHKKAGVITYKTECFVILLHN